MPPLGRGVATLLAPLVVLGGGPAVASRADTTPPVIESVTCTPQTLYVGESVSCSVVARDDESGLLTPGWTFGDGGTGEGATVTHTYLQPGLKVVTVTAVDGAGNSSTSSDLLDVFGFPPPPPDGYYTEPTLGRVHLRPGTISAGGTTGAPRRTRLSFRLGDLFDTTRVTIAVRGAGVSARRVLRDVDEGVRVVRLGARVGGTRLTPGRYRVVVRVSNRFGDAEAHRTLRVVR